MVSLCGQILTTTSLLGVVRTASIESEANWSISYKKERGIRKIDPGDCLIEEKDGQRFIFCTARFSVATPKADEDGPPVDEEEWRNLTLFLERESQWRCCPDNLAAGLGQAWCLGAHYHMATTLLPDLDPRKEPNYKILVSSSLSGIMLLACLLGCIFYKYRFEVTYIIHMIRVFSRAAKGEGKPHSECIYDAFVCYSGRDRTWVLRVLQPALEECNQKYRLCLHDRDFTLGNPILQSIVDSIDKSRKTLLILSENFVDNQWCRWEMDIAYSKLLKDGRNFLVLIELERIDRKVFSGHLRYLMDTRTYLEWPTDLPPTNETLEKETNLMENVEYQGNSSEQDFWRRLYEVLGDSLYQKEQKVKNEAEIAMLKTKEREADVSLSAEEQHQHC